MLEIDKISVISRKSVFFSGGMWSTLSKRDRLLVVINDKLYHLKLY